LLLRGEPRADWQLHDIVQAVLVSIIMNMFAFSYSALIAPIGLDVYRVSPVLVGALAAAEPLGAIAIGIPLSTGWLRLEGRCALLRGSLLFVIGLAAMALSPWYALAFVLLLIGGLGTAAFSNMQTTLILIEVPPAARSRVMGIVTIRHRRSGAVCEVSSELARGVPTRFALNTKRVNRRISEVKIAAPTGDPGRCLSRPDGCCRQNRPNDVRPTPRHDDSCCWPIPYPWPTQINRR